MTDICSHCNSPRILLLTSYVCNCPRDKPGALKHIVWTQACGNKCEICNKSEDVCWEDARTMYEPEGCDDLDPNRPIALCRPCAKEYHEYWDEMWSNINTGT